MNYIIMLDGHPNANCGWRSETINGRKIYFLYSYNTLVLRIAEVADSTYSLWCENTYSSTTRKHIGWFTKEIFGKNLYTLARACAADKKHKPIVFTTI